MPSGPINLKKMIQKKRSATVRPELKQSVYVLPQKVAEERKKLELQKKEKIAAKRIEDIKHYKRSLNRIWIAKYIESHVGIPFMEVCAGLDSKDSKIVKLVKETKQMLVNEKFGVEKDEE